MTELLDRLTRSALGGCLVLGLILVKPVAGAVVWVVCIAWRARDVLRVPRSRA